MSFSTGQIQGDSEVSESNSDTTVDGEQASEQISKMATSINIPVPAFGGERKYEQYMMEKHGVLCSMVFQRKIKL